MTAPTRLNLCIFIFILVIAYINDDVCLLINEIFFTLQPAPLFAKIEVCTVNALKIKFGNQKSSSVKISESSAIEKYSDITSLEQMEALVTKQVKIEDFSTLKK